MGISWEHHGDIMGISWEYPAVNYVLSTEKTVDNGGPGTTQWLYRLLCPQEQPVYFKSFLIICISLYVRQLAAGPVTIRADTRIIKVLSLLLTSLAGYHQMTLFKQLTPRGIGGLKV